MFKLKKDQLQKIKENALVVQNAFLGQKGEDFLQQKYYKKLCNIFAQEGALGFKEYL